jgi:hypothetical protein
MLADHSDTRQYQKISIYPYPKHTGSINSKTITPECKDLAPRIIDDGLRKTFRFPNNSNELLGNFLEAIQNLYPTGSQ